jgi:hypothetical protein
MGAALQIGSGVEKETGKLLLTLIPGVATIVRLFRSLICWHPIV